MKKEEILAKSRAENNNQDLYEKELQKQASTTVSIVLISLATLFFVLQIFAGGGINYGLYALTVSVYIPTYWVRYIKVRKNTDLFLAITNTLLVIALSSAHIYNLFSL